MNGIYTAPQAIKTHREAAKKRKAPRSFSLQCFVVLLFMASPALADCVSPAGMAGTMEYFAAPDNVFKFCNGTEWVEMGGRTTQFTNVSAWTQAVCPAGFSVLTCNSVGYNTGGNQVCGTGVEGNGCKASCAGGPYFVTATCYK